MESEQIDPTKGNGKGHTDCDVVQMVDRRSVKDAPPPPEEPRPLTPEEREQQARENRITIGRETGMSCLLTTLRLGRTPAAREVIAGILDLGGRADQTERLFGQVGTSFEQLGGTIAQMLGYLAACDERRRMPWWRRWRMPHPEFPSFGPHVVDSKAPPVAAPQPEPDTSAKDSPT